MSNSFLVGTGEGAAARVGAPLGTDVGVAENTVDSGDASTVGVAETAVGSGVGLAVDVAATGASVGFGVGVVAMTGRGTGAAAPDVGEGGKETISL